MKAKGSWGTLCENVLLLREKSFEEFFNVSLGVDFCGCVLLCGANMGELNPNALLEDEVELEVEHRKEVAVAGLFR